MRFSVMFGAFANAGDFLIIHRSLKLLEKVYPGCEIKYYWTNESLEPYIDEINSSAALIFPGGPGFWQNAYPNNFVMTKNLDDIKVPIFTIGMGWFGLDDRFESVQDYTFSDGAKELFGKISNYAPLSCRDLFSMRVLHNAGLNNCYLTGCPALYDIDVLECNKPALQKKRKICISDPSDTKNYNQAVDVYRFIKNYFDDCEIHFVFHRVDKSRKAEFAARENMKIALESAGGGVIFTDITKSCEGFKIYDDCFMHIGYRVHAHIYNLSQKIPSILIEEDGRGNGINEFLGFPHIKAWSIANGIRYTLISILHIPKNLLKRILNTFFGKKYTIYNLPNVKYSKDSSIVIKELETELKLLCADNFSFYESIFKRIEFYYQKMLTHIESFRKHF